jgi:predicted alpha-1,6-mannanase (GH76 family)
VAHHSGGERRRRCAPALAASLLLAAAVALLPGCGHTTSVAQPSSSVGFAETSPSAAASPSPVAGLAATSPQTAALAFDAFGTAFYRQFGKGRTYFATDTSGGYADFWKQAEMIEMVEDAYDGTHDPAYEQMIVDLETQCRWYYGKVWTNRIWNDDITWAVIAALRAYEITGDKQYLTLAQTNFDAMYARAWTSEFGGGMWWTTQQTQKDVTTTAPAAIAACMLFKDAHDPAYLAKAKRMYAWVRATLYDARTGAVYDNVSHKPNGKGSVVATTQFTYNQGTFIGAADLLFRLTGQRSYYEDALRTMRHTRSSLTNHGILQSESQGGNVNGGGFKGIFVRHAVAFARDNHLTEFDPWFVLNATAAWTHRDPRDLMGQDWAHRTRRRLLYSWDCSAGVVILELLSAR